MHLVRLTPKILQKTTMAPSNNNTLDTAKSFIIIALFLLAIGMLFGITGAFQYIVPGAFKEYLSFEKIRPLHVTSVVFWILFASMGAVTSYLQQYTGKRIVHKRLFKLQLYIFLFSILAILTTYFAGLFGGREYWEFHPLLAFPISIAWILFIINFITSLGSFRKQPVYVWMWLTGIFFFLFTFIESYLWVFSYFGNNVVNDMTIQWKSYGSMVGAWNMLIYGSSIFLMEKVSGNKKYSNSRIAFILYFTGLFNLMFNWGHHIYTLPTYPFIKHISYAVSMTELFILGRIIFLWKDSVSTARKHFHVVAYRFILAADVWIFLTLILAIFMSVPAINVYTHGTHITVAHTMGATIGINSFLLLAMAYDILKDTCLPISKNFKWINRGYYTANIALMVFWVSLIVAGILKAKWQMSDSKIPFSSLMIQLRPYFVSFFISGIVMLIGFYLIIYPLVKNQIYCSYLHFINEKKVLRKQDGVILSLK